MNTKIITVLIMATALSGIASVVLTPVSIEARTQQADGCGIETQGSITSEVAKEGRGE
jgi:hypothetical protein